LAIGFFAIFALVGLGMIWPLLFRPIYKLIDARRWIETPCRIIHAEVRSHSDDDGTTYSVDIFYEYAYCGQTLRSNRYDLIGGSSSGRNRKETIVKRYRTMPRPVCFVNPADPTEAVLIRKPTWSLLLVLFPLLFLGVGIGGMYGMYRSGRRAHDPSPRSWLPPIPGRQGWKDNRGHPSFDRSDPDNFSQSGWVTLSAMHGGRFGKFLVAILIAAFWNGIVSVFLTEVIQSFQRGRPHWFLAVFLIPFVLVGLAILAWVIHQFFALFNPRPVVQISSPQIPLGSSAIIRWRFRGRSRRIGELSIRLTATEEIPNISEENSTKAKPSLSRQKVFDQEMLRQTDPERMASGEIRVTIPADAMHSFRALNHKITWIMEFRGDILFWPNLSDDFTIVVIPPNIP
jgi:hypothetical protein